MATWRRNLGWRAEDGGKSRTKPDQSNLKTDCGREAASRNAIALSKIVPRGEEGSRK